MTLLVEGGRESVSTRAVSIAAGVQPPAIYRLFGDKQGLLDAVAADGFASYLTEGLARRPSSDPIEDLRRGWDVHVGFGLANPYLYSLAYGGSRPGSATPAAVAAAEILADLVHQVAQAGGLRVAESSAVDLITAAECGTTLTLIAVPPATRDLSLSERAREATLASILSEALPVIGSGTASAAIQLRAALPAATVLTASERGLLGDWLERIAAQASEPSHGGHHGGVLTSFDLRRQSGPPTP